MPHSFAGARKDLNPRQAGDPEHVDLSLVLACEVLARFERDQITGGDGYFVSAQQRIELMPDVVGRDMGKVAYQRVVRQPLPPVVHNSGSKLLLQHWRDLG